MFQNKYLVVYIVVVLSIWLSGCCIRPPRTEPSYPENVQQGWHENNGKLSGRFVLKKGEYTEHGGLRIELVDIKNNNGLIGERTPILVKIKIVKTKIQKTLCDEFYMEGSNSSIPSCNGIEEFGVKTLLVGGVNVTEGWADIEVKD